MRCQSSVNAKLHRRWIVRIAVDIHLHEFVDAEGEIRDVLQIPVVDVRGGDLLEGLDGVVVAKVIHHHTPRGQVAGSIRLGKLETDIRLVTDADDLGLWKLLDRVAILKPDLFRGIPNDDSLLTRTVLE